MFSTNSKAEENNIKLFSSDEGVLSIMYHRFDEFKYPSTNIQMNVFMKHIQLIVDSNYNFIHPEIANQIQDSHLMVLHLTFP